MQDLFAMGGYGAYVWSSYGLTAVVLVALVVLTVRDLRARQREMRVIEQQRQGSARPRRAGTDTE